jgi:hypothetical protein
MWQHLAIAQTLLEQYAALPRRVHGRLRDVELELLRAEARTAWEGLWDQLDQARRLAAAQRCDLRAYEHARACAGDIYLNCVSIAVGPWLGPWPFRRRRVTWVAAPIEPAIAALRALAAIAPS